MDFESVGIDERPERRHFLVGASGAGNMLNLPAYVHALRGGGNIVRVVLTPTRGVDHA